MLFALFVFEGQPLLLLLLSAAPFKKHLKTRLSHVHVQSSKDFKRVWVPPILVRRENRSLEHVLRIWLGETFGRPLEVRHKDALFSFLLGRHCSL